MANRNIYLFLLYVPGRLVQHMFEERYHCQKWKEKWGKEGSDEKEKLSCFFGLWFVVKNIWKGFVCDVSCSTHWIRFTPKLCLMRIFLKFHSSNLSCLTPNISVFFFIHVCTDRHCNNDKTTFLNRTLYISCYLICIQNGKGKWNWTFVMKMEFLWSFCCPKSIVYIFYIRFYSILPLFIYWTSEKEKYCKSWLYKICEGKFSESSIKHFHYAIYSNNEKVRLENSKLSSFFF
jgi:hypothetical protein